MSYKRADEILPNNILKLIQEYVNGECIYIPRIQGERRAWGSKGNVKAELEERNQKILSDYLSGMTVAQLAQIYFLSEKSIQRIIRNLK